MDPGVRVQVVPLSLIQAEWTLSIKQPTKSFVPQQRKPTQRNHICSVHYTSHKVYDLSSVLHVRAFDSYLTDIDIVCVLDDCTAFVAFIHVILLLH